MNQTPGDLEKSPIFIREPVDRTHMSTVQDLHQKVKNLRSMVNWLASYGFIMRADEMNHHAKSISTLIQDISNFPADDPYLDTKACELLTHEAKVMNILFEKMLDDLGYHNLRLELTK